MIIKRILTNNAAVIDKGNGEEQIVCGKGIAYKKKIGDNIDEHLVTQVFSMTSGEMNSKFEQLLKDIPIEEINLADEIIQYAKLHLGRKIEDSIYISLSDHIHMAIVRFLDGILVKNALLWDVQQFYSEEYAISLHALEMIKAKTGVALPLDEAGFIALHLVNASLQEENVDIYRITKIMQELLNLVKYYFRVDFDTQSVYYYRFITHLKFFASRLVKGSIYDDKKDDSLYHIVKEQDKEAAACTEKIAEFIAKKYAVKISNEEKLYLTIYIARLISKEH